MKTAKLITTIRTFFEDGTYRNNSVELTIPEEAARLIVEAWELKGGALPVPSTSATRWAPSLCLRALRN